MFSPADVIDIDDATVAALASESEEFSMERTRCSEKLRILEDGLRALQDVRDVSPLPQGTEIPRDSFRFRRGNRINVLQVLTRRFCKLVKIRNANIRARKPAEASAQSDIIESSVEHPPPQEELPQVMEVNSVPDVPPPPHDQWSSSLPSSLRKKKKSKKVPEPPAWLNG